MELGDALSILLTFAFFIWMFWPRRKGDTQLAPDGPESEPYRIYTRKFDREILGRNVRSQLMSLSPDMAKGHFDLSKDRWLQSQKLAREYYHQLAANESGPSSLEHSLTHTAVQILVDQSGSMKGEPMAWTAAGVRALTDSLLALGCSVAVTGYTTAGWHGGFPRQQWLANMRPKRPGRLCATLYITYKSFQDQTFDEVAWLEMLDPNILRENIDGEAFEWGETKLLERPEAHKVLLVLSDGAPVDDSTLAANGPAYLERHLLSVVSRLMNEKRVFVAGIGLDYGVWRYFPHHRTARTSAEVVQSGVALIDEAVASASAAESPD